MILTPQRRILTLDEIEEDERIGVPRHLLIPRRYRSPVGLYSWTNTVAMLTSDGKLHRTGHRPGEWALLDYINAQRRRPR